jgi:hypothetical protein
MNLNDVRYILAKFTDKADAPEELDARLTFGSNKNFAIQWEAKNWDALRLHKVVMGGNTPPLYVTGGYAPLPTDYFGQESATVFYGTEEKSVEFLQDQEFDDRKRDYIEIPTVEFPIGNIQSNYIRFLPKSLQYVNFSYIKEPGTVHFAYTTTRGFIEYDPANSVELLWDDEQIANIIILVLQDMGIQATPEQVKKAKE